MSTTSRSLERREPSTRDWLQPSEHWGVTWTSNKSENRGPIHSFLLNATTNYRAWNTFPDCHVVHCQRLHSQSFVCVARLLNVNPPSRPASLPGGRLVFAMPHQWLPLGWGLQPLLGAFLVLWLVCWISPWAIHLNEHWVNPTNEDVSVSQTSVKLHRICSVNFSTQTMIHMLLMWDICLADDYILQLKIVLQSGEVSSQLKRGRLNKASLFIRYYLASYLPV